MAGLVILTADELIALDVEGRGPARRAARETPTVTRILRTFLDRGGPIPTDDIVAGLEPGSAEAVHDALMRLDEDERRRRRRSLSDCRTAENATSAARSTRSGLPR